VKDYKLYFQYATNNHRKTAMITFFSYLILIGVSAPALPWLGVKGFLVLWAAVEALQVGFLHRYNVEFLQAAAQISLQPALRLAAALSAVVTMAVAAHSFLQSQEFLWHTVTASCVMALLFVFSYYLFGLRNVFLEWRVQLTKVMLG
jgi:hypothetical protein